MWNICLTLTPYVNDCDSVNTLHTSADVIFITSATVFVSSVWSFSRCLGNVWLLACITQDSPGHGNLNHHHQPSCAMEKIHFNIGTFKTTYLAITDGCLRFSFPGGGKSCLWRDVIEIKKEVIINWIIQRSSTACWWQILEFYTGWGEANQEIWLWMKYQIHSNKYGGGDDEIIASEPQCAVCRQALLSLIIIRNCQPFFANLVS